MSIGKIVKELIPDANNKRNSEGAFYDCGNGKILFFYSRFGGDGYADDSSSGIAVIASYDNGETFSEPRIIICSEGETLLSLSALRLKNGGIALFYLRHEPVNCVRMFMRVSFDEGGTWSEERVCTDHGYYCVANDRVIRLSNGRIVIPASFHCESRKPTATDCQKTDMSVFHSGVITFFVSDDEGESWRKVEDGYGLPENFVAKEGLAEPCVVELPDNSIKCFIRSDFGALYEMESLDNGDTWCKPRPTYLSSSISPAGAYVYNKKLLVFYNPVPLYNGRNDVRDGIWCGARNPLSVVLSDDGKRFSAPTEVDYQADDKRGFCYPAALFIADGILLSYCAGGVEDKGCLNRLRIKKIKYNDIFSDLEK